MKEIHQTKMLLRYKGKYLLLKKVRDIHPEHIGGWEVPGGKIKPGEEPPAAGVREIKEETGLNCKILQELKILELEKNGIMTKTYVYVAEADSNKVTLSSEHSEYKWISVDEIDKLKKIIYAELFKKYVLEAEKIKSK